LKVLAKKAKGAVHVLDRFHVMSHLSFARGMTGSCVWAHPE